MKKAMIFAAALLAGALSAGTVQMDLSAGGSIQYVGNKAKGEKNGTVPVKMIDVKGKKLPQIVWNVKDSPYVLFNLKKSTAIKNYSFLVFKLKLEVSKGCPVTAINLRFLDKNGEVFQYRKYVDLKKGGIFDIEIPINKKHFSVCWGGNPANKKVDQPINHFHFAFDYARKPVQDVKVIFHSMTGVTSATAPIESTQIDLSSGGSIQYVGNKAKGEKRETVPVKIVNIKGQKRPQAVWNVKDSPYLLFYPKKNMKIGNYSSLTVKLKIEVTQGCPITAVNLRFNDKNGEVYQYRKYVDLKKGGVFEIEIPVNKKHFTVCWGGNPANKIVDQPISNFHFAFDYSRAGNKEVNVTFLSLTAEAVESPATAVVRPLYEIGDCTRFFG